jgi:protein-tyrosine phosphatase
VLFAGTNVLHFLMLCTANICRSPIAEAVMRRMLADSGLDVGVSSAGLAAPVGVPVDPLARETLAAHGYRVDPDKRSRALLLPDVQAADMIFVMEQQHRRTMSQRYGFAASKTWLLGHWNQTEIADPVGRNRAFFEHTLESIETELRTWFDKLRQTGMLAGGPRG